MQYLHACIGGGGNGIVKLLHGICFCQDCSSTACEMVKGFQPHRMALVCGCRMWIVSYEYTWLHMYKVTIGLAGRRVFMILYMCPFLQREKWHGDTRSFWSITVWTACQKQAHSLFNLSLKKSASNCDQKHEHFICLQVVWLCFHAFETQAVDCCLTLSTYLRLFESLNLRIKSTSTWDLTKTEDETALFSAFPRHCSKE